MQTTRGWRLWTARLAMAGAIGVAVGALGADRSAAWKEVDEATRKGQPRTAIEKLGPILQGALEDHAWGEAAKVVLRRVNLETSIEGGRPEERIRRLEAELSGAPALLQPVYETVLGHAYSGYLQQNRWRLMQQTAVAGEAGGDLGTWDLKKLVEVTDGHFQRALESAPLLQKIDAAEFGLLLTTGTKPDPSRPTLFDVLSREALKFYSGPEQSVTRPEDAFEVEAAGPALGTVEEFLSWKPQAGGGGVGVMEPMLRAVEVYQALLRFHLRDEKGAALAEADLDRLVWANNVGVGPEKEERFEVALKGFVEKWADLEVSARALHRLATMAQGRGEPLEAWKLADRGRRAHPDTAGGNQCENLVRQLEIPVLNATVEGVWNAPWPKVSVRYRHLTNVYMRLVAGDWQEEATGVMKVPERMKQPERRVWLGQKAVRQWSRELPATTNYQERVEEVAVPADLEPGYYRLVVSSVADPAADEAMTVCHPVWVSDLAVVTWGLEKGVGGLVVDALTGEAVSGATVERWDPVVQQSGPNALLKMGESVVADGLGFFEVARLRGAEPWRPVHLRVKVRGQVLVTACAMGGGNVREAKGGVHRVATVLTDRGIYRPGQTVHYKVVCLEQGVSGWLAGLVTNEVVKVVFRDSNQREVGSAELRANEFGSCAGAFTAPSGGMMGMYWVVVRGVGVADGELGAAMVRVEEYKRPKFEVTMESPVESAKLGEEVKLKGRAAAYTGAAVDGARVGYRVVRTMRLPVWCRWWPGPTQGAEQEMGRGVARTGADGAFEVKFVARPDRSVLEANQPTFDYRVTADVTDGVGETRSAERVVSVGYVAMSAEMEVPNWVSTEGPMEVRVRTRSLDGVPQVAEGVVRLHALRRPAKLQRGGLNVGEPMGRGWSGSPEQQGSGTPETWELGDVMLERPFSADTNGETKCVYGTVAGAYRLVLETQDRFGKKVRSERTVVVVDPEAEQLGVRVPSLVAAPRWSVEPGGEFKMLWGTGYEEGRAYVEMVREGKVLRRLWTGSGRTQEWIREPVTEAMRGGFWVRVVYVRENRSYAEERQVEVPWTNKKLELSWERFRSKLEPGQKETWSLKIQKRLGVDGAENAVSSAMAELAATLYDASLDAYQAAQWPGALGGFAGAGWLEPGRFGNQQWGLETWFSPKRVGMKPVRLAWRELLPEYSAGAGGGLRRGRYAMAAPMAAAAESLAMPMMADAAVAGDGEMAGRGMDMMKEAAPSGAAGGVGGGSGKGAAVAPPPPRKNLSETAFFMPQLRAGTNGVVRLEFTMPEALTSWRFLGMAHDKELRSGFLEAKAVTAKDLMVQPNPPRFLREGDVLEFSVKVSNQSDQLAKGAVRLNFFEVVNERSADKALGLAKPEQAFEIPAKESRSFGWRIAVPDGQGYLVYRASATAGALTDGEEGAVPVLSRRVWVTESMPLPVRGPATNRFEFKSLAASGQSGTLRHQGLKVEMVSNPAWYAVMALPYLMEYPHECSEQTFNRLYANALARSMAAGDPRVRRVFNQWTNTAALDSPLEKNQDLKAVMVEETPWLREAKDESAARRRVGLLFEDARLGAELERAERKLVEMQGADGRWPWFQGGGASDYLTLYIVTGYGRLRHLGVDVSVEPALRALAQVDARMQERCEEIRKQPKPEEYVPSAMDALYLYGRSFYLKERPLEGGAVEAVEFLLKRAEAAWPEMGGRQSQAHVALALHRWGGEANQGAAAEIMKSLKERSVTDAEMGRYWRDEEGGWWWHRAPIETQALMIEALDEVAGDAAAVEECRVWLLKQKQTQDWRTTKATADAVYALLLRGRDWLGSTNLVRVELGGVELAPGGGGSGGRTNAAVKAVPVEAGTGMYERRVEGVRVTPKMAQVVVRKQDAGVAWGAVHWQYLEDVEKVKSHTATPLKLVKTLFVKRNTAAGPVLEAVGDAVAVGDELVTRVEIRVDRDMEFVHLKDQRGSGVEPVNVLSQYQFRGGLGFYESTRDTASHFFVDYLPKGTHVLEYSCRVQHRGEYTSGMAEIQSMYAPEFNSHSGSVKLTVK